MTTRKTTRPSRTGEGGIVNRSNAIKYGQREWQKEKTKEYELRWKLIWPYYNKRYSVRRIAYLSKLSSSTIQRIIKKFIQGD